MTIFESKTQWTTISPKLFAENCTFKLKFTGLNFSRNLAVVFATIGQGVWVAKIAVQVQTKAVAL